MKPHNPEKPLLETTEKNCVLNNNNKMNEYNYYNNYNNVEEDRRVTTFCISASKTQLFREHCRLLGKKVNICTEQALIDFITSNPVEHKTIIIQQKIIQESSGKKNELKIKSLSRKILKCMKTLKAIRENKMSNSDQFEDELLNLIIKGTEMMNGGEDFMTLLEEAYTYLE